ncbi:MAG: NAD(+) synthase [Firmicutes bacterium]|nr:NAD(+) synthase [Bacillota bacterium]
MKYGFVKVCAATPDIKVGDCDFNAANIIEDIKNANDAGAKLVVFPELCITGYTCGDLFLQKTLLDSAGLAISEICRETANMDILIAVGAPIAVEQKLYNCAVLLYCGKILAIIPKTNIPNYAEFYEMRHFAPASNGVRYISYQEECVPFGTNILIKDRNVTDFVLAVEICEDLWTMNPPSGRHAAAGATVIANLSASDELIAKAEYRKSLVSGQSARLFAGYIYSDAGFGESSTDLVYSGDNLICENGNLLARSKNFSNELIFAEIDVERLAYDRRRTNTFSASNSEGYCVLETNFDFEETQLTRKIERMPFVPQNTKKRERYSEEILSIQACGLAKRLVHTGAKTAIIGISGGLDSTLALLVASRAFDIVGCEHENIIAVTMPCFGTTSRTYNNAIAVSKAVGASLHEVNIKKAVMQHFEDIGQDANTFDITYENSQARERTQVLMDIANKTGGLVIGTGDMSELALGWATYNGDHMSMYAVNVGVPKTLIKYLVEYEAQKTKNSDLCETLYDILDTPVSPELLPPQDGKISQKTEQFVGPYILHDFFLYYMLRFGFSPSKIYHLAKYAFCDDFGNEEILKWMKVFYRRFFSQQFKRSCIPDGPKVGSVALSPRGDWRMPSDASAAIWLGEIDKLTC